MSLFVSMDTWTPGHPQKISRARAGHEKSFKKTFFVFQKLKMRVLVFLDGYQKSIHSIHSIHSVQFLCAKPQKTLFHVYNFG